MLDKVFDIENFNVFSDDKYYYFFRALEELDIVGIENNTITNQYGRIIKLITDREFYGEERFTEDSEISLEEMVEHIKMHYNKHTNCISFSSNANVSLSYGRSEYENSYIILRASKDKIQEEIYNAGLYMLSEVEKQVKSFVNDKKISQDKITLYQKLIKIENQEDLDIFINDNIEQIDILRNIDMLFGGIEFVDDLSFTRSKNYNALNEQQNFLKNKIIAMIDLMGDKNIIPNVSNPFLIQTIGNAFSSLEIINYKDVDDKHLVQVSAEFMDVVSLVQQVPNIKNIDLLKSDLIDYINGEKVELDKFKYDSYKLSEDDYSIERMYDLTKGDIDYKTAISIYRSMFYLTKSRLRTYKALEWLKIITNNNPLYNEIYEYIRENGYGIESAIITRLSSNNKKLSESVGFNFNNQELIDIINSYSEITLDDIINDPINSLRLHLRTLSSVENNNVDKTEYFAQAIVDSYNWKKKLNISKIYDEQKREIINKLKEANFLDYYYELKNLNLKEQDIINVLLTNIIKGKELNDIDINDTFTVNELELFLEYSKIKNGDKIKLRTYQVPIVNNINNLHKSHKFATAVTPTGSGKSFIALKTMLQYQDEDMLYVAPNNEILNQLARYAKIFIYGTKGTTGKSNEKILKEVFPNLTITTYQKLLQKNSKEIKEKKYKYIVLDELHRSGAKEWIDEVKYLLDQQDDNVKVLGISATPQRDVDYNDMSDYWAEYLGYTEEEVINKKHLACNIDLLEAIELGYIIKPKIICCKYNYLKSCEEKINSISNEEDRKKFRNEFEVLRRNIEQSSGIEKILNDNLKSNGKYIVFLPVGDYEDVDGNKTEDKSASNVIKLYQNQMMQYVYAGKYLEENIERFKEIENYLKDDIPFSNNLTKWIESEKENILLLAKMSVTKNSNLLVTESNLLAENIIQRMNYKKLPESKQGELLKQKTKSLMECYSMLGQYSNEKNKRELESFNSSSSNKQKFIFVMNKLNEGVHPDHVDGEIWLRPLNENSKILYLQQLGRCIHGLNDRETVEDEERPIVLDLVNNTLTVDYDKGVIPEERDLNILINIKNYLIDNGISDIDNLSGKESYVLKELIKLNITYKKYLDEDKLNNLDINRKNKINEIISYGFSIDLWSKEYSIHSEENTKYNKNSSLKSLILDSFEIDEELIEINSLIKNIEDKNKMTSEEKKNELIKTIQDLHRLPKQKRNKNDISEKVFRDGTDQRGYFDNLQRKYRGIDQTKGLTETEKQIIQDYNDIVNELNKYVIKMTSEEKKEELIKTIQDLKRLPKKKRDNDISEKIFRDGTDQRGYFVVLQKKYREIDQTRKLTEEEKQIIQDYNDIVNELNKYVIKMTSEEKKEELIKTIQDLKRLPRQKQSNNGILEKIFRDGTDQRGYFVVLQKKYREIDQTRKLTEEEKQIIQDYNDIVNELNKYVISMTSEEKKKELIKTIQDLKRLPKIKRDNGVSEKVFRDGTDQRFYFNDLQKKYRGIDQTKGLTETEKQIIQDYNDIVSELNKYVIKMTSEEKKEELIKTIWDLKRLPKRKEDNNGVSEKIFRDGTEQRRYFEVLQKKYRGIDQTKGLTKTEKQIIQDYNDIVNELNKYVIKMTSEEKKEELIKTIRDLKRLPKQKQNNSGISEKVFRDGTDQRVYFDNLQQKYKEIDQPKELTKEEKQTIQDYEDIVNELNKYVIKMTSEEKKNELIKTIQDLHRLPKQKRNKNDISEKIFRDGTEQRGYFDNLQQKYRKIDQTRKLTEEEKQTIQDYEDINDAIGIEEAKKYYDMYGDLNVCIGYKVPRSGFELREFLDRKRKVFVKQNKQESEKTVLNQLFDIYPDWVIGKDLDTGTVIDYSNNSKSSK